MSPRIEKAIHLPSGLHAGSWGPLDTAGNMCRSSRSEWPYRFGRAPPTATIAPTPSVVIAAESTRRRFMSVTSVPRLAELANGSSDRAEIRNRELLVFARHDDAGGPSLVRFHHTLIDCLGIIGRHI